MSYQDQINEIYEKIDKTEQTFDFSADKKIDINNLHTELQFQSEKGFSYNRRRAKLAAIVKDLEELKKQTRSRLINNCVANPILCDPQGKYTDKKAEAYYRLDSGYREVVDALLKASYEHDAMEGMQRIIEDNKWILKDLVQLSLSQYFESTESKETRVVYGNDSALTDQINESLEKSVPVEKEIPENKVEIPEVNRKRRRSRN